MGYFTNKIEVVNAGELSDFERIDSVIRTLIVSIEGTIPGSRDFGLSGASTDMRPEESRNAFFAELDEKVEKYIPEIQIEDVEFDFDSSGRMTLRVFVEPNEDMEVEE